MESVYSVTMTKKKNFIYDGVLVFMRLFLRLILFASLFFGVERFCRWQTRGFQESRLVVNYPYHPEWEMPPLSVEKKERVDHILQQSFYFLDKGAQSFAFVSEDDRWVLKFFKRNVFFPEYDKVEAAFTSCKLVSDCLQERSGILLMHFNPTLHLYPKVTLYDKLGILHHIDLDNIAFIIQPKAESIFTHLEKSTHLDRDIKEVALFFTTCASLGLRDGDTSPERKKLPTLVRNYGFVEDRVIPIDVGSFFLDLSLQTDSKKEIAYRIKDLKKWVETYHKDKLSLLEEAIH